VALRFAADGTDEDPGPRVVHAAELGGLALLAAAGDHPALPDAEALEHAASAAPWMLTTLHALASTVSLRAAAELLGVHHSTLHDRVTYAEQLLGWNVREPQGRLRLQLALALRRLRRHP
jgi:DNA-binding PucR family transcriptional regulator